MTVTIQDVRDALNNITIDDLADATVQQKIADGILIITKAGGDPAMEEFDLAVKAYAAWQGYLVANIYESVKIGDLSAKLRYIERVNKLKEIFDDAFEMIGTGGELLVESTTMIDASLYTPSAFEEVEEE